MTNETFDLGCAILFATFPSLKVEPLTLKTWKLLLQDLPDEDFLPAVCVLCRSTSQVYPGTNIVALIRDACPHRDKVTAEEAWGFVMTQISGRGGDSPFSPEITARVDRAVDTLGGWSLLHLTEIENLSVLRAHFFRIYETFTRRATQDRLNTEVRRLLSIASLDPLSAKSGEGVRSLDNQDNKK